MFEALASLIVMSVFLVVLVAVAALARNNKNKSQQAQPRTAQKTQSKEPTPKPQQQKTQSTIDFGKADHSHPADEEEHYDKIVGSLGEVNDEGCPELDGLRLIVNDSAYNADSDEAVYDASKVVQTIILGEILGKPRSKNPHFRR